MISVLSKCSQILLKRHRPIQCIFILCLFKWPLVDFFKELCYDDSILSVH
nr:MAG TPA: hypothetical protein [Caudoviricetes sp.]